MYHRSWASQLHENNVKWDKEKFKNEVKEKVKEEIDPTAAYRRNNPKPKGINEEEDSNG